MHTSLRKNLTFRRSLQRFNRKTVGYSKSTKIYGKIIDSLNIRLTFES
ncbi:IS1 family transposase [Candidatus Enterovibrio altilux]